MSSAIEAILTPRHGWTRKLDAFIGRQLRHVGRPVLGIKYRKCGVFGASGHPGRLEHLQPPSGDADFDSDVDLTHFGNLASNFGLTGIAGWMNGDFERDGEVTSATLPSALRITASDMRRRMPSPSR
jgi:hypothetical protein